MAAKTEAQEEFDSIIAKASASERHTSHPDDRDDYKNDRDHSDRDEEDEFRENRVNDEMKFSFANENHASNGGGLKLPHKSFDSGRTTGVKGVIADARNYEEARRNGSWRNRISAAARESSVGKRASSLGLLRDRDNGRDRSGSELSVGSDEEEFMERWRQSRRDELVREGNDIRNRRTSPSVRRYGRFDDVNALGYLDAIEKVGRETVVVVFVYDEESAVSQVIQDALTPLVPQNPHIHFVKVHYEDIEFEAAGVPAVLAYKNQGDLFANLTYIIGLIPDDTVFDTPALEEIFKKHNIL